MSGMIKPAYSILPKGFPGYSPDVVGLDYNPELAKTLAHSGKYKVVFYGHTHIRKIEKIGSTLLVNPGEIMNLNSNPSFIIYNSENNKIKTIEI